VSTAVVTTHQAASPRDLDISFNSPLDHGQHATNHVVTIAIIANFVAFSINVVFQSNHLIFHFPT
jgi:hypothetical protein